MVDKKGQTSGKIIDMAEKKNANIDLEDEIDNKTERLVRTRSSYSIYKIATVVMLLAAIVFLFINGKGISNFFIKYGFRKNINQDRIYDNLKAERESYSRMFQKLMDDIEILKKEVEFNGNHIEDLHSKIAYLESKLNNISMAPRQIELIKVAINIQSEILDGLSYSKNLSSLKSLANGNQFIMEKTDILEVHKNTYPTQKEIEQDFVDEFRAFGKNHNTLSKNNDKISRFLSDFIIIRKTQNFADSGSDRFMLELERAMKARNYDLCLEILKTNPQYAAFFPKTMKALEVNVLLNNTIKEIIRHITNN